MQQYRDTGKQNNLILNLVSVDIWTTFLCIAFTFLFWYARIHMPFKQPFSR